MQRLFSSALLSLLLCFSGISCKKEEKKTEEPEPTYTSLQDLYLKLGPKQQEFTLSAAEGGSVITAAGNRITVPSNAWVTGSGQAVASAQVKIIFREYKDKIDLLFSAYNTRSKTGILKTGGAFYIRAVADGQYLQIAPGKEITIEQFTQGQADIDMTLRTTDDFYEDTFWVPADTLGSVSAGEYSYTFKLSRFRVPLINGTWFMACNAKPFSNTQYNHFDVYYEEGVGDWNMDIFLIMKEFNGLLRMQDFSFGKHCKYAPLSYNATIFGVSIRGGKIYVNDAPVAITTSLDFIDIYDAYPVTTKQFLAMLSQLRN